MPHGLFADDDGEFAEPFSPETAQIEAEAALALGRLDGLLSGAPDLRTSLFALRVLHAFLLHALTAAGHPVTPERFALWFAGLRRLSDEPRPGTVNPRQLVDAILASVPPPIQRGWEPLSLRASDLALANCAPNEGKADAEMIDGVLASAEEALDSIMLDDSDGPLPFAAFGRLCAALQEDPCFAPVERDDSSLFRRGQRVSAAATPLPSPRWALDLYAGYLLTACGTMRIPLPFPGLIRADAITATPATRRYLMAVSLRDGAQRWLDLWRDLGTTTRAFARYGAIRRANSRSLRVLTYIHGFGPLRVAQLQELIGATRAGTLGIIARLLRDGMVGRQVIGGVVLFGPTDLTAVAANPDLQADLNERVGTFSPSALAEFDDAMADIDRLLSNSQHSR